MELLDLIQIASAVIYGNFLEWLLHKYVLHGYGRDKSSFWSDHYHVHHVNYLKYHGHDPNYEKLKINTEMVGLVLLGLLHVPLVFLVPIFYLTLVGHGMLYYIIHRQAHCDSRWGWRWIPWHMQHHMGGRLEGNWCVLFPLWDYIMRTRFNRARKRRRTVVAIGNPAPGHGFCDTCGSDCPLGEMHVVKTENLSGVVLCSKCFPK